MNQLTDHLQTLTGLSPDLQMKFFWTLSTIIVLWALRLFVVRIIARNARDTRSLYMWRKTVTNIAAVIGLLVIGRIWFEGFQSLATFAGLLSAGLAIALKDLLVNMAGWMFILWRKPFKIGQRIQIGDVAGDVIDIRLFQFSLLEIGNWVAADQPTGRIVHIPNGKVFTDPQSVYHGGFDYIWNEIPVLVTFESNWKKAKEILSEICLAHASNISDSVRQAFKDAAHKFLLTTDDVEPRVFTAVQDSGVLLTLRYLCPPSRRRGSEEAIWENILDTFSKNDDIDFAYPTTRYYNNVVEGKEGARAKPPDSNH